MKYLVVTDIHGSSESAKIIIDRFNELKCDKIIILGDILYHGPRNDLPTMYNPKEVISIINPYSDRIIAIQGNCDAEVDQMVLNFRIEPSASIIINGIYCYCTHGHHINYQVPIRLPKNSLVLYGHTHINRKDIVDDVIYYNVGSITIPKNDTSRCYAILDENGIVTYDLDGKEIQRHCFV